MSFSGFVQMVSPHSEISIPGQLLMDCLLLLISVARFSVTGIISIPVE